MKYFKSYCRAECQQADEMGLFSGAVSVSVGCSR